MGGAGQGESAGAVQKGGERVTLGGCGDCVCKSCLLWWSQRCPYGGCYDEHRAKVDPWPGPVRKSWTDWNKPGEQAHWCRGGARWEYGRPLIAAYEDMAEAKALILPVANGLARELQAAADSMRFFPFTWPDAEEEAAEAIAAAAAGTSSDPPDGGPPSPKGKACDDEPGGD